MDVGPVTARERPDVASVGLGANSEHALELVDKIVRETACPVIVLLHEPDPSFVKEASKRGVFAYISDDDVEDWQSSIDIALRRFAEYQDLEGVRPACAPNELKASSWSATQSTSTAPSSCCAHTRVENRRLIDLAAAVVDGHRLLPKQPLDAVPWLMLAPEQSKRSPKTSTTIAQRIGPNGA